MTRGCSTDRNNRRGRDRFQPQQHQWSQSSYQQPLWTTRVYPRQQQQWAYPWQTW
ncbi:hypothetical protein A2U01_0061059, partial [Trifolium medium]|nr:hypothetical protein [Trifolium medium]